MRVLLAYDKFKDALSAQTACELTAHAIRERYPDWSLDTCPLADGGEGFAEILTRAAGGATIAVEVDGPRAKKTTASFGLVSLGKIPAAARALLDLGPRASDAGAQVAVIEMASASGLALLPPEQRDPWHTTTFGTGELIRAAAKAGATAVLLGVGGSATNDLGLGALAALGLEFQTLENKPVCPPVPAEWPRIAALRGAVPDSLPLLRIACDVTNPLLGPQGAAAAYGPQKGLRPADRPRLENESARLALMLCKHCGQSDARMETPGTGAAGGLPFGLMVAARARLLPGIELVSAWLDLERRLAAADLVITGEGRFDESSLSGKGPGAIAARALALGKRVRVFAGQVQAAARPGLELHAITPAGTPLAQALKNAGANLQAAVRKNL
jgi:glycerate kinase